MFDQVLQVVKEHLGNNPELSNAIPADQQEAVHQEIANHVTNGLQNQGLTQGGGLLSMIEGSLTSGSPIVNAIEGGLVGSLGSKFGLSPMVTGAIAASLPGLLQKFAHKATNPNNVATTTEPVTEPVSNASPTGLGSILNKL